MPRPLISSKTVITKVVRDLNLGATEIPWQDLLEWIAEGLQHIGATGQYLEKEVDLTVSGYRAKLPEDFYAARPNAAYAYKIQGDNLVVGSESGVFPRFRYLAFATDAEGFPLVLDHVSYATALFWKCAMQLSIRGQLPNKELSYQVCKQNWGRYCVQAGAIGTGFGAELAARFAQSFTDRIPNLRAYDDNFALVDGTLTEPLPAHKPAVIPQQPIAVPFVAPAP